MKQSAILLSLLCAVAGVGCVADEGASDHAQLDTLESEVATVNNPVNHGGLPWNITQSATLTAAAGFHAWHFSLSATATVALSTSPAAGGPASVNTVLALYRQQTNGSWSLVTSNNDGPLPPWSRISRSLSSGTYRALVRGNTTSVTGAFALAGTCSGAGCAPASCPAEPALAETDASALAPAVATFNAGARNGYTWCRVAPISQYALQACPANNTSLEAVVNQLVNYEGDLRGWSFADGEVLSATEVAAIEPFSTVCSPGGPGLAASIRANVSSGLVMGWLISGEVPCHNCHEFGSFYVLYYPLDGKVILVPYITGYDS